MSTVGHHGEKTREELVYELVATEQARDHWRAIAERKGGSGGMSTLRWVVGIFVVVFLAIGTGWVGFVHSQVGGVQAEQGREREKRADIERKVDVLTERIDAVKRDQQEMKQEQRDQGKKLDGILELLRQQRGR